MTAASARRRRRLVGIAATVLLMAGLGVVPPSDATARSTVVHDAGHEANVAVQEAADHVADPGERANQDHAQGTGQEETHAAGENEHAEEEHGETWLQIGFRWINFFLLLAALWWLLVVPPVFVIETFSFPGLKVVLRDRSKAIIDARDLAERQVAEATESVAASAERLERISEEINALLDEARADADQELTRAEGAGTEAAERVRGTGARDLVSREVAAVRELRTHAADTVVKMARRILDEHLGLEDQDRLVRDYLDRFGERVR